MVRLVTLAVVAALAVAACGAAPMQSTVPTSHATPATGFVSTTPSPPSPGAAATAVPVAAATTAPVAAATAVPVAVTTAAPEPFGKLATSSLNAAKTAALQRILDDAVRQGAPDAIAAVITKDGAWAGASGIGGPDGRKATSRDEFAIASVTKMFTATLVLRLAEEGRIDLDAPLASYLGDLDVDANGATVRQTLGMLGGFAGDAPDAVARIHANPARAWTRAEVVKAFEPPVTEPGTTYGYSNDGYALLAIAAEHVTGTSFAAALRSEILDPVGADRIVEQAATSTTPKPWAFPTLDHAGGYTASDLGAGGALPCISSASYSVGGASMASDAPSLATWAWRLFDNEVISARTLALMTTFGTSDYGLGMERLTGLGTSPAYGHTGGKTGYGSILAVFPADRAIVVLFVNDPDFVVEPFVSRLLATSLAG
jgi:D-alanyl-D-alanine carboxypeptidase